MVSEPDLAGGPRFESHLCNFNPHLFILKSIKYSLFGLFDSPRVGV